MNEMDAIRETWRGLEGANRSAVLATVVHVTGSAYRRPGARMLLVPDGRRIGSISGGCLEGEIGRKAWWYTESGEPVVRVYDTTSDDDAVWEFGLGCNGVIHVMLERADSQATSGMLGFLDRQRDLGQAAVVATIVRSHAGDGPAPGQRLLVDAAGRVRGGGLYGLPVAADLMPHVQDVLNIEKSRLVHLTDSDAFVEFVGSPLSVVVFGAGHDAIPLAAIGRQLGWRVTIADGRPAYARAERFPGAWRVVVMGSPDLLRGIAIDNKTAVVMMTHNYPLDARLLPRIAAAKPFYLGMLGPKSRTEKLCAVVGISRPAGTHAPVGLDLGSDDPTAIALAIAAEIQAVTGGRSGGMLRNREGPIHSPAFEVGPHPDGCGYQPARPEYCETLTGSNV